MRRVRSAAAIMPRHGKIGGCLRSFTAGCTDAYKSASLSEQFTVVGWEWNLPQRGDDYANFTYQRGPVQCLWEEILTLESSVFARHLSKTGWQRLVALPARSVAYSRGIAESQTRRR